MDRRGMTSPRGVKVSHLASRLRRSARRGPQLSIFFSQNFTGLGEALWGLRGAFPGLSKWASASFTGLSKAQQSVMGFGKALLGLAKL